MLNMTINTVGTLNLSTEFGTLFVFSAFIETMYIARHEEAAIISTILTAIYYFDFRS
jgi:hypothetical protein